MLITHSFALTDSQLNVMSEISRDIAQVAFATMVVSPFLPGVDIINWVIVISGLLVSFACWILSIIIVRKIKI